MEYKKSLKKIEEELKIIFKEEKWDDWIFKIYFFGKDKEELKFKIIKFKKIYKDLIGYKGILLYYILKKMEIEFRKFFKEYLRLLYYYLFYSLLNDVKKDEFYFLIFFDFRGRRYYRGLLLLINDKWLRIIIIFIKENLKKYNMNDIKKIIKILNMGEDFEEKEKEFY